MLGTCTAAAEVSAYKQRALVARQNLGSSHKCLVCTRGTKILFFFLSRQYRCKYIHMFRGLLLVVWFRSKYPPSFNTCFKASQSDHVLLSPFCFRSICKSDKCHGSEIEKLEEETGNRRMSPPQYVTFPRLK